MKLSNPFFKKDRKPIFFKIRSSPHYVLVTVCIAMFVNMLTYSLIVPIVPFIMDAINKGLPVDSGGNPYDSKIEDSAETSSKTGLMLALFAAGLLVGSPIFGYLGDRIKHRKIPMLLGICGIIASSLMFLFINKYYEFLIARALQGFADASVWTLGLALVADAFPLEELGIQMSKVMLFYSVGLVGGAPIGGALYQRFGYKAPFILCVVLAGIDFFLRLFMVEKDECLSEWFSDSSKKKQIEDQQSIVVVEQGEKTVASMEGNFTGEQASQSSITQSQNDINNDTDTQVVMPQQKLSTWTLLRQPRLLAAALLSFANGTIFNVFEPTLTVKLSQEFGLNASQIGLIFLAQVIPTFLSTPLSGWISDRYGPKIVCIVSMPLCSMFIILMGTQNQDSPGGVAPLVVLFALQGFTAFAFLTPALPEIAYVAQTEGAKMGGDSGTGRSYSVFNMAFGLGALAGPLIGGYAYGQIGFFYLCVVMGCFLLACVPFIYFYTGTPGKIIDYKPKKK